MLLADRGYDADWIRVLVGQYGAWANIPPRRNRKDALGFSPHLYRARNLIERFFNRIKQCRRVATRYDKLAANYLAFVQLAFHTPIMSTRPRACTHKIAIGDSDLINVRFGPLCGLTLDISRGPRSANSRQSAMQQQCRYSIISSARAIRVSGTARPSALAVLRLTPSPYRMTFLVRADTFCDL